MLVLTIRFARGDDWLTLPEIERHAGEAFRALGMDAVADDDPLSVERLADYQQAGRAWVAEDAGRVVGYLLLDVVAGPRTSNRCLSTPRTHDGGSALN